MRVFITTAVQTARETLKNGFTDRYSLGDDAGVYVGERPLDINDGFDGRVTLCVNVPVGVFNSHEEIDGEPDSSYERRTGRALIPSAILNQFDPPQLYDHEGAGISRRDLLKAIREWEGCDDPEMLVSAQKQVAELKATFDFFEEVGWMAPIRLQEEQAEQKLLAESAKKANG